MSTENLRPTDAPNAQTPAAVARHLIRTALKGSLATLDLTSGHPFASLVLVATEPDGAPVLLLSRLALHTQNLTKDSRASLLIDGTAGLGDPLTGGRLTLTGQVRLTPSSNAKARFLARHPSAHTYADFPDFAMYALEIAGGHYIGGFGRIVTLAPADLLTSITDATDLVEAEGGILEHMNSDHADAVALYATELAQCTPGSWRMCGIDPDGIDLLHCSNAARVAFPTRVRTPPEARVALIELAKQARVRRESQ